MSNSTTLSQNLPFSSVYISGGLAAGGGGDIFGPGVGGGNGITSIGTIIFR